MPRSRMVKPEFFDDEKLSEISRDARLLFIGLWVQSDDYGVVKGNHKWLKSKIFPYDEISPHQFTKWIKEIEAQDCIRGFKTKGENYYYIRTFNQHQYINNPSKAKNPSPPEALLQDYLSPTLVLPSEIEIEKELELESKTFVRNSSDGDNGFDSFWNAYPKKVGKKAACQAYRKAKGKPPVDRLIQIILRQKQSDSWTKEDGQYIPNPSTWLNQGRWDDVLETKSVQFSGPCPTCKCKPCICGR